MKSCRKPDEHRDEDAVNEPVATLVRPTSDPADGDEHDVEHEVESEVETEPVGEIGEIDDSDVDEVRGETRTVRATCDVRRICGVCAGFADFEVGEVRKIRTNELVEVTGGVTVNWSWSCSWFRSRLHSWLRSWSRS